MLNCSCTASDTEIDKVVGQNDGAKSLYKSFYDTLKYSNYKVLFCYKLAFNVEIFKYNLGTYLTFGYFFFYLVSLIIYRVKGTKKLKKDIKTIYKENKESNNKENEMNISEKKEKEYIHSKENINSESDVLEKSQHQFKKKSRTVRAKSSKSVKGHSERKKSKFLKKKIFL